MKLFFVFIIHLLFALPSTYCQGKNNVVRLKVVMIRHAEKPSTGDNLCPKGLERALLLPPVLENVVGIPDFTYIPAVNTGKTTRSVRMLQTITPFAVAHNLKLNSNYKNDAVLPLAKEILRKNGTVLLVWEHSTIVQLARALGVNQNIKWKDDDYDSIWILEYGEKSSLPVFRIEQENLHPRGNCL